MGSQKKYIWKLNETNGGQGPVSWSRGQWWEQMETPMWNCPKPQSLKPSRPGPTTNLKQHRAASSTHTLNPGLLLKRALDFWTWVCAHTLASACTCTHSSRPETLLHCGVSLDRLSEHWSPKCKEELSMILGWMKSAAENCKLYHDASFVHSYCLQ